MMDDFESFFDKWPNWLRYILFLPLSIILCVLFSWLIFIIATQFASPDSWGYYLARFITGNFAYFFLQVLLMWAIIPKHKYTISLIIVVIEALFILLTLVITILNFHMENFIGIVLSLIAPISALIYCVNTYPENKCEEKDAK